MGPYNLCKGSPALNAVLNIARMHFVFELIHEDIWYISESYNAIVKTFILIENMKCNIKNLHSLLGHVVQQITERLFSIKY